VASKLRNTRLVKRVNDMPTGKKVRLAALAATVAAAVAFGAIGVATSGAYFSDTHDGSVTGTLGSIRVTPTGGSGTDNMDFSFEKMLPGVPQTAKLHFDNSGDNTQDVWLKFPNLTALSALNNLGTYGEAHVVVNGTEIWASNNLNDNTTTCPSGCNPLPSQLKLASGVKPGHGGTVEVTFAYAGKLKTQPAPGTTVPFNAYPVPGQFTVRSVDGTGSGLPYQLVATQEGQQP
jgi:hypothetical protein